MKKLFLVLIVSVLFSSYLIAQQKIDTLFVTDIYKDVQNLLVSEQVLKFDSIGKLDLIQRFENWGGKAFRNYGEVRTSKTESQITLSYNNSDMFIIMYADFKDGKIRISIFDDGVENDHSIKMINFFNEKGMLIYRVDKENNMNTLRAKIYQAYKIMNDETIKEIDNYIRIKQKDSW